MSTLENLQRQQATQDSLPRRLYCYRYYAFDPWDYDEEDIWRDVQSWGGSITIRGDCIDFFVPCEFITFFVLKYPELARQTQLEYI